TMHFVAHDFNALLVGDMLGGEAVRSHPPPSLSRRLLWSYELLVARISIAFHRHAGPWLVGARHGCPSLVRHKTAVHPGVGVLQRLELVLPVALLLEPRDTDDPHAGAPHASPR